MRNAKWIVLMLCAAVLTGCDDHSVVSIHPLYDSATITFEPSLVGTWKIDEETWTFERSGSMYRLSITEAREDRTMHFEGAVAQLAGFLFLDLSSDDTGPTGAPAHVFFKLTTGDGMLHLAGLDNGWMEKAIMEESNFPFIRAHEKIVITAPTADLQYFFRKHGSDPEAFPETGSDSGLHFTRAN